MKKITFFIVILGVNTFAQQIPNNSFENWITETFDDLQSYFDGSESGYHTVTKETDSYEGNYAIKMETIEINDELEPGFYVNFDPDNFTGGVAYTSHVDSIRFHYKAHLVAQDSALFLAYFKKDGNIIGGKIIKIAADQNTDEWTEYSFATDMPSDEVPDTLMIGASSSNAIEEIGMEAGSWFMLDDIVMISNTSPEPEPVANNGFEEWNTIVIDKPEDFETSLSWSLVPPSVIKVEDDATDGEYSIKLINVENADGELIIGNVTNGQINTEWPYDGGYPLEEVPNSASFDVKAKRINNDEGGITFTFKKDGEEVYSNGDSYDTDITDYLHKEIEFDITEPVDTLVVTMWNGEIEGSELQFDNIVLYYTVGIQDDIEVSELKAFPVPAKNNLIFEINVLKNTPLTIEITGINGKKLIEKNYELSTGTHQINLDITGLPKGTYIYNIITGEGSLHKTFLKK